MQKIKNFLDILSLVAKFIILLLADLSIKSFKKTIQKVYIFKNKI